MATGYGRTLTLASLIVGLGLWAQGIPASAQAADPVIGTWKLDLAKSKYRPGPPPRSLMMRVAAAGKGIKVTTDEVDPQGGQALHTEYTADYDGKDHPIVGSVMSDTVSPKHIAARAVEHLEKKGGKSW